jgi:hypothetical protein
MIEFKLYSVENPKGLILAKVADQSMANVLKEYFKQTYDRERFLVTVKLPRKKEEKFCGWYEPVKF